MHLLVCTPSAAAVLPLCKPYEALDGRLEDQQQRLPVTMRRRPGIAGLQRDVQARVRHGAGVVVAGGGEECAFMLF